MIREQAWPIQTVMATTSPRNMKDAFAMAVSLTPTLSQRERVSKVAAAFAFGLLLTAIPPAMGAEPISYRFSKAVEYGDRQAEALLAVPLDSQVYAATRDGFADLRILDQAGAETPFVLEKAVEPHSEIVHEPHPGAVAGMRKRGAAGIEVMLRADKDTPPTDGLTLVTPLTDYEHQVQVFGSDDGKSWSPLVQNAGIYDYSRYMDVSNRDIPLPANGYRHFKLVIEEAAQTHQSELMELTRRMQAGRERERSEKTSIQTAPLRIDRVEFWHNVTRSLPAAEKKFDYPVVEFKAQEDPKNRWTVIDLKTSREPLTQLALQSPNRNFSRTASVQVEVRRGIESQWRDIGGATVQSLHFENLNREQAAIPFPEQRQSHYRILIRDQDNPPLQISAITAQGNGYRLLFLAAPGKSYRVHYGAEKAERPRYDTAPIIEPLRAGSQPVEARLGAELAAAEPAAAMDFAKLLNSRLFLGAVIALTVAVLAWALVGVGRRIGQMPQD